MDRTEIYDTLGIAFTADEGEIRKAYRERLAVTNPEDDPDKFMKLRAAYEEACRLAKLARESGGELPEEQPGRPRDESPSGLWMEKVEETYGNIRRRRDAAQWKELFNAECFLSLEEEENCRYKFFLFLMNHFRFPGDVWKLLDQKLGITRDAAKLREKFPADFVHYIYSKCETGEEIDFFQFEGADDADYDAYLQDYDRCLQAFQEGNTDLAETYIKNADQLGIRHPVMEICRAELMTRRGAGMEALKLLEELKEKYPDDVMVSYSLGQKLWELGEEQPGFRERSVAIFQELKDESETQYMVNVRLAEWYCDQGRFKEAKECVEKVLALAAVVGGDASFLKVMNRVNAHMEKELEAEYRDTGEWEPALELCWCYLQDGKVSRGLRLARKLEGRLPKEKEAEYRGLLAKLYLEQAEFAASLSMTDQWEKILQEQLDSGEDEKAAEKDRERMRQARMVRMQCWRSLGYADPRYFVEALRQGDRLLEDSVKDVGVLLEMAQAYLELREYERCLELVDRLVNQYQVYVAYATAMEAYHRQKNAGGVVSNGRRCIQYFPGYVKPYEYLARVYLELKRKDDFQKLLEEAEKNGVKSPILDAYAFRAEDPDCPGATDGAELNRFVRKFRSDYFSKVENGDNKNYQEGLDKVTEYLYRFPDSYMLVERGLYQRAGHHYKEAKADFEKALSIDPSNPYALNGLSMVYRSIGDYEKALICIKKAILYRGKNPMTFLFTDMAKIYSLLGDYEMALEACCAYEREVKAPEQWFYDQKEECCLNLGKVQEAVEICRKAFAKGKAEGYRSQVDACVKGGRGDLAGKILKSWKTELDAAVSGGLLHRLLMNRKSAGYCSYYNMAGWVELMSGDPDTAIKKFSLSLRYLPRNAPESVRRVGDAVYAAAVCGRSREGIRWAKRLREFMDRIRPQLEGVFYDREKMGLYYKLLTGYFGEETKTLEEQMAQESACQVCDVCYRPVCKELEGIHILLLIRGGKREEAAERLKRNLEIQPGDEYMLAIRHTVFRENG